MFAIGRQWSIKGPQVPAGGNPRPGRTGRKNGRDQIGPGQQVDGCLLRIGREAKPAAFVVIPERFVA